MGINSVYFRLHFDFSAFCCSHAQLNDLVFYLWEPNKNNRDLDSILKSVCFEILRVK